MSLAGEVGIGVVSLVIGVAMIWFAMLNKSGEHRPFLRFGLADGLPRYSATVPGDRHCRADCRLANVTDGQSHLGQDRLDGRRRCRAGGDLVFQGLPKTTRGCLTMFDRFFGDERTNEPMVKAARVIATVAGPSCTSVSPG